MITATCHCGAVRIDMRRKPRSLTSCNCSICRRYGTIWAYFSRKSLDYHFETDAVAPYVWGRGRIEFYHCKRCGCITHYENTAKKSDDMRVGVNVRNADPAKLASVSVNKFDGASSWTCLDDWEHGWA